MPSGLLSSVTPPKRAGGSDGPKFITLSASGPSSAASIIVPAPPAAKDDLLVFVMYSQSTTSVMSDPDMRLLPVFDLPSGWQAWAKRSLGQEPDSYTVTGAGSFRIAICGVYRGASGAYPLGRYDSGSIPQNLRETKGFNGKKALLETLAVNTSVANWPANFSAGADAITRWESKATIGAAYFGIEYAEVLPARTFATGNSNNGCISIMIN